MKLFAVMMISYQSQHKLIRIRVEVEIVILSTITIFWMLLYFLLIDASFKDACLLSPKNVREKFYKCHELQQTPVLCTVRWYHSLGKNCTRGMVDVTQIIPVWDWTPCHIDLKPVF